MSEPSPSDASDGSSWWASLLTTAREKSTSALNVTKRDLAEFVSVISSDTKAAVSGASTSIKGILKKTDSQEEQSHSAASSSSVAVATPTDLPSGPYDRSQAQLLSLQSSPDTYLTDPADAQLFKEWQESFDVQSHQTEISSLLVTCSHIRSLQAKLVPARVAYELFWQRYFYKMQLMKQEEERRAALMARAKPREEKWQWDEDTEEVGSTVSAPSKASEHHRSESSDSFVCVPDDVASGNGGEKQSMDTESWESVGHEVDKEEEEEEGGLKLEVVLEGEEKEEEEGGETVEEENGGSDWENWDD